VVYENPYQQVYKLRLDFGDFSKEIFVTDYGDRVGVVVEGPEGILLVRQYRHLIDRVSWEIPGGKVDQTESLEEAARRECVEETGIVCRELSPLLMFHPGLDTLYNPTHLFHSHEFEENPETAVFHGDEVSGRDWIPLEQCISMISSCKIVDSLTIIGLLSYHTFMKQK
jgi:8-oxo-dGTP pyrophosphatase MutT (NUDIX family)